jgi:hypothetical protein
MDLSQPEIRRPLLPNLDEAMKREEFGARDWTPLLPPCLRDTIAPRPLVVFP